MKIERVCPMCRKTTEEEYTREEIMEFNSAGLLGIDKCVNMAANRREFLKTGYCMKCQDMLFNFSFDDYEDEEEIGLELND